MSKLEVDKIDPQSGTDLELGSSGDTITIPTGVTLDASNATTTLPANVVTTDGTQTLTNKTIAAGSNTVTGLTNSNLSGSAAISNANLANSSITINDTAVSLGGSTSISTGGMYKNIIINGDMSIAQRGTSTSGVTTTDGYYACDRWYSQTDTGTWTISQSTDVPTGQGFVNSFKMDCTSAGTGNADEVMIRQKFEGQNLQYLKYGTSSAESLTLSFWIKSNKTGNYYVALGNFNTTQNRVVSFGYSIDSADTWEKKTITIPGDTSQGFDNSNVENFTLFWLFSAASGFTSGGVSNTWTNYAANRFANSDLAGLGGSTADEVYLTGVQLEVGSAASDFEFLPVDVNLNRCMRYYNEINEANNSTTFIAGAHDGTNGTAICPYVFPVSMRAAPTVSYTGTFNCYVASAGTNKSDLGIQTGTRGLRTLASSVTGANGYAVHIDFASGAKIHLSAEL